MTVLDPPRRRAICWLLALAGTLGCEHPKVHGAALPAGPERGDHIVIEQTAAEFFEARVLSSSSRTLQVQTVEGGNFRRVQASDAYRLPPPLHDYHAGDLAICAPRPAHWEPCRITRVDKATIDAVDGRDRALHVPRARVLAPTALTRLDLQRYFERATRRRAFVRAAAAAGRPTAPRGWRPAPREQVLALHDAHWYAATIHEVDDDVLRVRWRADSRVSELPYNAVVPEPPYKRELHRGDFVLARPTSLAAAWQPAEVVSVGADTVEVSNIAGDRRTLRPADVLPLGG